MTDKHHKNCFCPHCAKYEKIGDFGILVPKGSACYQPQPHYDMPGEPWEGWWSLPNTFSELLAKHAASFGLTGAAPSSSNNGPEDWASIFPKPSEMPPPQSQWGGNRQSFYVDLCLEAANLADSMRN